jgi:hypothetical protein
MPPASKPPLGLLAMIVGVFLVVGGCLALGGCLFLGLLPIQQGGGIPPGSPEVGRRATGTEVPRPEPERRPAGEDQARPDTGPVNPNVRFGLPAPAKADPESREAYLLDRPQYVLSYNAETRTPNWVCWRLRAGDIGNVPRQPFEPDPDLPRGIARVTPHDYDGSGFDRGHRTRSRVEGDKRAERPRPRCCPVPASPVEWQGDGAVTPAERDEQTPWQADGGERSFRRPNSCTGFRPGRRHDSVETTSWRTSATGSEASSPAPPSSTQTGATDTLQRPATAAPGTQAFFA